MSGSDFKDEDPAIKAAQDARAKEAAAAQQAIAEANRKRAEEETRKMGQGDQG